MRRVPVLAILVLGLVSVASAIAIDHYLAVIKIHGNVNTGKTPTFLTVEVNLDINTTEGTKIYRNIVSFSIRKPTWVQIVPKLRDKTGDFTLSLSGVVYLKSETNTYRIPLPCMITVNESCYRPLMVIPGYDSPLKIEPGTYNLTLEISWRATGKGSFDAELLVVRAERVIIPMNTKPENTENWTPLPNSTKSYGVYVRHTENGTLLWVWVFAPITARGNPNNIPVIITITGNTQITQRVLLTKTTSYYEHVFLLKLEPGKYKLEIEFPSGKRLITTVRVP